MATMMVQIRARRRTPLPSKITAAGLDLFADRTTRLAAGKTTIVPTGVGIKLPPHTIGRIDQRLGLSLNGVTVYPTIVNTEMKGEIRVAALNSRTKERVLQAGTRIAKLVILPVQMEEILAHTQ